MTSLAFRSLDFDDNGSNLAGIAAYQHLPFVRWPRCPSIGQFLIISVESACDTYEDPGKVKEWTICLTIAAYTFSIRVSDGHIEALLPFTGSMHSTNVHSAIVISPVNRDIFVWAFHLNLCLS